MSHPFARLRLAVVAAVVLVDSAVLGCNAPIDSTHAAAIARDFAVAGQASNEAIYDVRTSKPSLDGGAWRVQVDLLVTYAPEGATPEPSAQRIWIHYWIRVDTTSGQPNIEAQG